MASLVCRYDSRYSKALYPVRNEAFCHGFSRDITERNDLRPHTEGVAIDACQLEGEAVRWWKCSNQIDMVVLKSFNCWSKRMQHRAHFMMSFSMDGQMMRSWMWRAFLIFKGFNLMDKSLEKINFKFLIFGLTIG
ncbi:hypothetical protein TNCV_3099461 [Trichonephila clavipes]|nr:hypothetical protein TNCV_3099461 [Trichonephila clavipes]